MIGMITKGTSISGALRYDMEKEGGQILDTNCAHESWQEIAVEMDTVAASNTRCEKTCIHLSMSAPDGERLSDEQWKQAGEIARRELNLENHQFAMTRHNDAGHDHVHIVINRVDENGRAWSDKHEYRRVHEAMRTVEKEMGLEKMQDHQNTNTGRFNQTKTDLQDSVKAAHGKGLEGLRGELDKRGYDLKENRQSTGRVAGISIQARADGKTWKASELQKGGWRSIEKQLNAPEKQAGSFQHPAKPNPLSRSSDKAAKAIASKMPSSAMKPMNLVKKIAKELTL